MAKSDRRSTQSSHGEYEANAALYDHVARLFGWRGPEQMFRTLKAKLRPGMHVMDVGTGTGLLIEKIRTAGVAGLYIIGTDISPAMLEICARKGVADKLVVHDINQPWPFADASQNIVATTGALEHIADPRLFVAEASRVLKPGGAIAVTFLPQRRRQRQPIQQQHKISAIKRLFREAGIRPGSARQFLAYRESAGQPVFHIVMDGIKGNAPS